MSVLYQVAVIVPDKFAGRVIVLEFQPVTVAINFVFRFVVDDRLEHRDRRRVER